MASRTQHKEIFSELLAPFETNNVKSRTQAGRKLFYITARTAMNRLDQILGPENWWDTYQPGENSVICRLTIRLPDGQILTKEDAGGYAGMADQGDDDKSGFSDAFKRAAVKFGVGRYLYNDGVADHNDGEIPNEPHMSARTYTVEEPKPASAGQLGQSGQAPKSGRALFAWTKEQEQKTQVGLLNYLNGWAKNQHLPGRMVDWTEEQVRLGHAEALRKLGSTTDQTLTKTDAATVFVNVQPSQYPKPRSGKEFYNFCNRMEQEKGITLVRPADNWRKDQGIHQKIVDLSGDDLDRVFGFVCSLLDGPPDVRPHQPKPSHDACWTAAWEYLRSQGGEPDADQIMREVRGLYAEKFETEMPPFDRMADTTKLDDMTRAFREMTEDANRAATF